MSKRKYIYYATPEKIAKINPKNQMVMDKYFKSKGSNLSESSRKNYESDFNQLFVFLMENYDNQYIVDILRESEKRRMKGSYDDFDDLLDEKADIIDIIEDFIHFCRVFLGNNERRIQRRLSSISSLIQWLRKRQIIRENPLEFIERPKIGKGEKPQVQQNYLTEGQVEEIRRKLKKMGDLQLELFFEMGISTMARVNALSNIRIDQIVFDYNLPRIKNVVEKQGYIVDLKPSVRALKLAEKWIKYREENGIENDYLFITKYGGQWKKVTKGNIQNVWVRKIGQLVGIENFHAHDLRHSAATILKNRGVPLETIQLLLHHKSPQTTLDHYIKIDEDKIQKEKMQYEI